MITVITTTTIIAITVARATTTSAQIATGSPGKVLTSDFLGSLRSQSLPVTASASKRTLRSFKITPVHTTWGLQSS